MRFFFLYCIGSMHYSAKQGQVGTLGNRHVRPTHGFFKWGFRQNLHLLHLGAKQPVQFLHRERFLKPVWTLDLLISRIWPLSFPLELTINGIGFNSPHLQTIVTIMCRNDELSWLFTNRFRSFYLICRK